MANIKSQKKRILTNEKRPVRNQSVKSELKTLVRHTREAVEAGDKEKALAALRVASRRLQGRHPQEPGREPQVQACSSRRLDR